MGNVIDLKNIDGPVVDDLSTDNIAMDMMEQTNIVKAMLEAIKDIDIPHANLSAYELDDGRIVLRNEMMAFEDGNGSTTLNSGPEIHNATSHIVGASVFISELDNGNYKVDLGVIHSGSYEQNTNDYSSANIQYEIDAENGEIISREGSGLNAHPEYFEWVRDAAQTIEHNFAEKLGPNAQESLSQFRLEGSATSVGEPPIHAELNSLSEITLGAENVNAPTQPQAGMDPMSP